MTDPVPDSFLYEHCDVPDGVSLSEWRARRAVNPHRRAQLTGGLLAAVATFAPVLLSVRGSRKR